MKTCSDMKSTSHSHNLLGNVKKKICLYLLSGLMTTDSLKKKKITWLLVIYLIGSIKSNFSVPCAGCFFLLLIEQAASVSALRTVNCNRGRAAHKSTFWKVQSSDLM